MKTALGLALMIACLVIVTDVGRIRNAIESERMANVRTAETLKAFNDLKSAFDTMEHANITNERNVKDCLAGWNRLIGAVDGTYDRNIR